MERKSDFIVNPEGRCFLCRSQTLPNFPAVKIEPGHLLTSTSPSPTYSLRCLSRYLNLDLGNVPSLLNCKTIQLCADCASLNDKFSEAYRQLEKSEMEIAYYSELIQIQLNKANTDGIRQGNRLGNQNIMKELRMKIKQKYPPRIKLRKLYHGNTEKSANISNRIILDESYGTFPSDCSVDLDIPEIEVGDVKVLRIPEDPIEPQRGQSKISTAWKSSPGREGRRNFMYKKTHQCKRCFKMFTSDYYLKDHYNSVHLHLRRKCKICSKEFKYRQSFNLHNRKFHGRFQRDRIPGADAILVHRSEPGAETRGGSRPKRITVPTTAKERITSKLFPIKCNPQSRTKITGRYVTGATGKYVTGATIIEPENSTMQRGREWILNPITHKYKCTECPREYMEERSCQDHYNSVHRKIRFRCNICSKIMSHRQSFNVHYKREHQGIRFKCLDCLETFTQMSNLWIHQRKSGCGAKSADNGDNKNRKRKHMEYEHDLVDKSSSSYTGSVQPDHEYSGKERGHDSNRPLRSGLPTVHRCPKCPKTFSNTAKLAEHELSHDKDNADDGNSSDNATSIGEDE